MITAIYNGYQILYHAIQDNIEDVNPSRREKKDRWVYPTLPTSLDKCYPRITIKLASFDLKPVSAGGILYAQGNERSYGYQVSLGYKILLFVNKETMFPIEINGSIVKAKNELLTEYLATNIYKTLFKLIVDGYFSGEGFFVLPTSLTYIPSVWEYDTSRLVTELSITVNTYEEICETTPNENVIETINHLITPNI